MSNDFDNKLKGLSALNRRVDDLCKDGYYINFMYQSDDMQLIKMVHHNGNRISLILKWSSGTISQRTNNKEVYCEKVY